MICVILKYLIIIEICEKPLVKSKKVQLIPFRSLKRRVSIEKDIEKILYMKKYSYTNVQRTNSFTYSFQNKKIFNLKTSKYRKKRFYASISTESSQKLTLENMNRYNYCGFPKGVIRKHIFIYKLKNEIKVNNSEICIICLGSLDKKKQIRRTPCGHMFHANCISKWFRKKKACPYCRLNLVKKKAVVIPVSSKFSNIRGTIKKETYNPKILLDF